MTDDLEPLIDELCRDYARPWTVFVSDELCPQSKQAAQTVQDEVRLRLGVEPVAWKLGMASESDRAQNGDDVPIAGWLTAAMVSHDSGRLTLEECTGAVVECEIALEIGTDIRPGGRALTVEEVADAVVAVRASIELPTTRFTHARPSLHLMEAANSGSYRLIVGEGESFDSIERLFNVEGVLEVDGSSESATRLSQAERADPLRSLLYLADSLTGRGESLSAGQIVTTGINLAPLKPRPGDYRFVLPALGEVRLLIRDPDDGDRTLGLGEVAGH